MRIDTLHCKNGVPYDFIKDVVEANSNVVETIYFYDNDLVDEDQQPYSVTVLKPGDKVVYKSELAEHDGDISACKELLITDISPATYGFLNVFLKDIDGNTSMSYSGDLFLKKSI